VSSSREEWCRRRVAKGSAQPVLGGGSGCDLLEASSDISAGRVRARLGARSCHVGL